MDVVSLLIEERHRRNEFAHKVDFPSHRGQIVAPLMNERLPPTRETPSPWPRRTLFRVCQQEADAAGLPGVGMNLDFGPDFVFTVGQQARRWPRLQRAGGEKFVKSGLQLRSVMPENAGFTLTLRVVSPGYLPAGRARGLVEEQQRCPNCFLFRERDEAIAFAYSW